MYLSLQGDVCELLKVRHLEFSFNFILVNTSTLSQNLINIAAEVVLIELLSNDI
jgi:hypothetical protein